MEYKKIDELSISECCALLDIERSQLPEILDNISGSQDIIDRLRSLLDADMSAFKSCSMIEQFEKYLELWIDGLHRSEAAQRVAQLKAQAEELAFYKKNQNSISGLESYIKRYPSGKFTHEAKVSLANKKRTRKIRNIILLVLLLIAASIFAYCNYVPVSYVNVDDNAELNNLGSEISLGISTDAISSTISATSSEDWVDCRVSGKTLYISANANPEEEKSATITITAHSSFFGSKLSDRMLETITVSQETGYASYLSVSNNDVYLTADAGSESLTINTDGVFFVSTEPDSWVTASIDGNVLKLDYTENSGTVHDSYLVVSSGNINKRINITQAGKQATILELSETDVSVSHLGGTRTIYVSTDGTWEFGTDTESWIDFSRSGNTITLNISSYSGSSDRSDYFTIKSGNLEKRINITQTADNDPRAEVNRVWVEHNIPRTGYNRVYDAYWGWQQVPYTYNVMRIHVDFDVDNMKGKTICVCAYFYDEDGNKMRSSSNNYKTSDGQVSVQGKATATYKNSNWSNFTMEIPYSAITKGDNKFVIQILDNNGKYLGESDYEYFTRY